ncbi:MAG: hypothetical protein C3F12_12565 [Candidatus Methylomirabilota bacterium]|nr:helix-hairpin-helix domain-containing protein [Candidatus Methylomirabilis sp.]NJD68119.1 hypothetical protein [candidate division NC10 bacterium]PWB43498.1 MAG: hypothetical protein C3F12_12565 [candidate division NC10 bacterium]
MKWIALWLVCVVGIVLYPAMSNGWLERRLAAEERGVNSKSVASKLDINTASMRELQRLPGISPEVAERVVRNRPYHKLDELIVRNVLGRKELARIKEWVRVNGVQ